jgi:hypothetical protein
LGIGRDADAVVLDRDAEAVLLATRREGDFSARLGALGGVDQQIREDLRQPHGIAVDHQPFAWHVDGERVRTLLEERAGHLDGLGEHGRKLQWLLLEPHLAARDARDVEQVVDEPAEVPHLPLDHLVLALIPSAAQLHELQGGEDGRQRVAQLMAEQGEELVLAAIGLARLAVEAGVLEGQRGAAAQLIGHLQIRELEPAVRLRRSERDGPQHAAARGHRDGQHGVIHHRSAAAQDAGDGRAGARAGRESARHH